MLSKRQFSALLKKVSGFPPPRQFFSIQSPPPRQNPGYAPGDPLHKIFVLSSVEEAFLTSATYIFKISDPYTQKTSDSLSDRREGVFPLPLLAHSSCMAVNPNPKL